MLTWLEAIIFAFLLLCTVYGFFQPIYLRYKLITSAKPESRFDNPVKRIIDAFTSFFFLRCSLKRERVFTGIMHIFLLYGSLTFDTVSINHILEGFNENWNFFGHGVIRQIHSAWSDIFGIMVLVATLYFIIRRFVFKPKSYTYPNLESVIIYALLITVTLTFYLYEGAAIALKPNHAYSAFIGKEIASWLGTVGEGTVKVTWWLHILNVFAFVLYVPRSKYQHMFFGPINIATRNYRSSGYIKPLEIDLEKSEKFGVVQPTDLSWRDIMDGFACIDCGRCDDYCPANRSGKPLSPKNLILKLKKFMLNEKDIILKKKEGDLKPLMDETYTGDELWTCTTCGACMQVCPVKNEHIPKIIGMRQSQVMMETKFPEQLNLFFKNMETNSNPWGFGAGSRADWTEGLEIKTLAEDSNVDILFWVGCAGSFDERSKKVTLSLVKVLKQAGINFGILGLEENCCGDQARRLGNEYMFQMLAQMNIETIKRYNIKKILVTCPHGYNTLKNDYPEYAKTLGIEWDIEVIHHTQYIAQLLHDGKLKLSKKLSCPVTYHDPCYLGRHNTEFGAPREVLSESGAVIREMKDNHEHSMCCGAGGGLMWTEEHLGKRINHLRTEMAVSAGAEIISTSCPFCMTMLEDGVKDSGKEESFKVRDIAEIVAESL